MSVAAHKNRPSGNASRIYSVLVVDDSAVARAVLTRMIEGTAAFRVASAVSGTTAALKYLETAQVDIILLDIDMPGVDGITALPDLLRVSGNAKIMVVSSSCDEGGAAMIQALALGAVDTLVKPGIGSLAGRFAAILESRLSRLVDVPESYATAPVSHRADTVQKHDFDIVAIGASTGGIHAMAQVLRVLPPDFTLPILITQHLPASFMSYFATQVALLAGRPCEVAKDRAPITEGRIMVAPGDAHLCCVRNGNGVVVQLIKKSASSGCLPSVDPMLDSIAQVYGDRALAIILSGMGRDGATGASRLHEAGGTVVVQDQASSVVWGMPGAVASLGKASAVLPPDQIGRIMANRRKLS